MLIRRFPRVLAAAVVILTALAGFQGANASSPLTVAVLVPPGVPAGFDAPVIIRAEGDTPELASLDFEASGGQIIGVVSLNAIGPGVAEGTIYVRRDVPGDASIIVRSQGVETARGTVRFAAYGQITVSATLAAGAHASARTWRFEVVDSAGAVVSSLSPGTSGDSPTGAATSPWLPYGSYTVRQVLGNDTRPSCGTGAFYAISSPLDGTTTVTLAGPAAAAAFALLPCPEAPASLSVSSMPSGVAIRRAVSSTGVNARRRCRDRPCRPTPAAPGPR